MPRCFPFSFDVSIVYSGSRPKVLSVEKPSGFHNSELLPTSIEIVQRLAKITSPNSEAQHFLGPGGLFNHNPTKEKVYAYPMPQNPCIKDYQGLIYQDHAVII